jgi:hypothetical protein
MKENLWFGDEGMRFALPDGGTLRAGLGLGMGVAVAFNAKPHTAPLDCYCAVAAESGQSLGAELAVR